jgi:restriction system protein
MNCEGRCVLMAVPGFQEMFLPFLQCLADGNARHTSEVKDFIVKALQISKADQDEMLKSLQSTKVANRVGWARTHLSKAKLIEPESRGIYRITEDGRRVLLNPPSNFDLKFLDTIPAHKAWRATFGGEAPAPTQPGAGEVAFEPPNERIESAYAEINQSLASGLLDKMSTMDAFRFEQLVVDLLFAMGYGGSRQEAAKVTQKSGDEGIDGVINEDRLGLDVIYVQAKRWQGNVGRPEIQSFVGALAGKQAHKGVFITTSQFSQTAAEYARAVPQKIILIDGARLAELMIEHNIGVSTVRTLALKRIDSDYFEEA